MATAIGLSMQLSASTSGLTGGLSEAEKLINKLGRGAESAAKYFDTFRNATTGELPAALQSVVDRAGELTTAFRAGSTDSESFASGIADISAQAASLTKAFQEGASVTAQFTTEEEKRAAKIERLGELLEKGAISQQVYDRAIADASGANAEAAAAERALSAAKSDAERITRSVMTAEEKYAEEVATLERHLEAGRISQETFDRATAKAKSTLDAAATSTKKAGDEAEKTGLKFNELSGFFSLLPGPIGNVAGRISGFSSTIGGVQKLIDNPKAALDGLGSTFDTLTTRVGLAVAGVAAFGAAATAVTRGLLQLEDRVEQLGNQADKLGTSFQFIQVLETAAERSGNSIGGLSASFNRFLNAVDGAKQGSEKTVAAFARIGISADDLKNKKPEEIYKAMAIGITEIADPAARAGIAMDLLGRSGLDLIPTFKQITNSERDLERYFAVLTEVDKINLDEFGNSVDALNTATRGLGQALLLPFVGLGDGVAKAGAEFVAAITAIIKPIGELLAPAFSQIGVVIEVFATGLGVVARAIGVLAQALEPVAQFLLPAVVAQLVAMNAAAIASGVASLVTTMVSAATAAVAYATSAGVATAATVALGTAIRATLASTGVGALVVGLGLAANALYDWFTASETASGGTEKLAEEITNVADASTQFYSEITKAVDRASSLGEEGIQAAVRYQKALQEIAELASEGEYDQDQLKRAVANATAEFENSVKPIEAAKQARDKAAKAAEDAANRQIEADRKVADQLIENQRIDAEFGGNKERAKAAEDLLAINREIERVQAEQAAAAAANDKAAESAAAARLAALDQAKAAVAETAEFGFNQADVDAAIQSVQDDIAKSIGEADIQIAPDAAEDFFETIKSLERELELKIIDPKQFQEAAKEAQKTFDAAKQQAEKVRDLELKYAEEAAKIQEERIEELSKLSQTSVQANDVRTSAGASEFLRLASGREDPAIEEYRKQLKKLEEIKREIAKAQAEPVEIL